jgi:hypothetical protein
VILDSALLAFFHRALALYNEAEATGIVAAPVLIWNGAAGAGKQAIGNPSTVPADTLGPGVPVYGRYYHAVQITALDGSDSFAIQGSLDGLNFVGITSLTALAANGISQFTGLYKAIRAIRNSGTGVASQINLLSRF